MAYNGNKWGYDKFCETRKEVEVYNYAQKTWNKAGFWGLIISVILIVVVVVGGMYLIAYIYDRDVNRAYHI